MSTLQRPRPLIAPVTLGVAAVGGLAAGVLTSVLQGVLPGDWNTLANSGAVWTVVACALALVSVDRVRTAVAAGTVALLAEVAGYYAIALPLRDVASSPSERVLWTCAALVVGPLAGLAAHRARRGSPTARTVALLALCGVAAGEAWHGLARIPGHLPASRVELVLAVSAAALVLVLVKAPWTGRVLAVLAGVASAGAVALVYGAPVVV